MIIHSAAGAGAGICAHNSGGKGGERCIVPLHLSQLQLRFKFGV